MILTEIYLRNSSEKNTNVLFRGSDFTVKLLLNFNIENQRVDFYNQFKLSGNLSILTNRNA